MLINRNQNCIEIDINNKNENIKNNEENKNKNFDNTKNSFKIYSLSVNKII